MACEVCNKTSDAAQDVPVGERLRLSLCGTHFDQWLASHERGRFVATVDVMAMIRHISDFVLRVRAEILHGGK